MASGFPEFLNFFVGLQTQLNFAECSTLNPNVEGQKCTMENFSVFWRFAIYLQRIKKKKAKKFMINLHTLKLKMLIKNYII